MGIISKSLLELQKKLQILPGIGEKTAQRLAYFIVNLQNEKALELAESIVLAIDKCKPCSECFLLSDSDPCTICTDHERNQDMLCIVESSHDVYSIENTQEFHGRYFVLGNLLSPVSGIGPEEIRVNELSSLLKKSNFKEVILALSPSIEGETTMQFLADYMQSIKKENVFSDQTLDVAADHHISQNDPAYKNRQTLEITRLATGIPYGSDMEYIGSTTLLNALKRRLTV